MESLKKIQIEHLIELKGLYKIDWPLHITTCSTIQNFLDRFRRYPEWIKRVSFFSINEEWKQFGTFVMINENRIFFNTLESFPFKNLRKTLLLFNFEEKLQLVNIRDALRPVVADLIRIHHLEVISDIGTKCFLMSKENLKQIEVE